MAIMNETQRFCRPAEGGYERGDRTRRKIIEAGIDLFGRRGFAGASTRDIAVRAGVNAPALRYYFDSKEGLYRACAESLADEAWQSFEPEVKRAREILERNGAVEELLDVFVDLLCTFADLLFLKGLETGRRLFLAREQAGAEPEIGSQVLGERLRVPLNEVSMALLARITGLHEDDPLTVVRMFSLYGQFTLFHFDRQSTLLKLGWSDIDVDNSAFLKDNVGGQIRILLEHWCGARQKP